MKIGVLADTHLHCVDKHFKRILQEFLSEVELICHVGDFVSSEIVDFLRRKDFHGVHGNMDSVEVKRMLPRKKLIQVGPYRLGLIHGAGPSMGLEERVRSEFEDVDVILYGHSHRGAESTRDGVILFNPGTATGFSYSQGNSLGILELGAAIECRIVPI